MQFMSTSTVLALALFPDLAIITSSMASLEAILPYIQITLSVLIIIAILLQQKGAGVGGAFGGDNFSATFNTRRGAELFLFRSTIVLGILFALSALLTLII